MPRVLVFCETRRIPGNWSVRLFTIIIIWCYFNNFIFKKITRYQHLLSQCESLKSNRQYFQRIIKKRKVDFVIIFVPIYQTDVAINVFSLNRYSACESCGPPRDNELLSNNKVHNRVEKAERFTKHYERRVLK